MTFCSPGRVVRQALHKQHMGALFLFDFSAAFPSLSHEYLWSTLEHIGVPPNFIRATKLFYQDNKHQLKMGQ